MAAFFKTIGDVVSNAVVKQCTFYNDTEYQVMVVDHDGTRALDPGCSEGNYLVAGFSLDLVMKFPGSKEEKVRFSSSEFGNRTHRMSVVFRNKISAFEDSRNQVQPTPLQKQDCNSYVSSLPASAHMHLDKELDWSHDGVETDLSKIADRMIQWEEKLATHLGLTSIDIYDIKETYRDKPVLQRREALRRWKRAASFQATYRKLLEIFANAGHSDCAETLCEVLKNK